MRPGWQRWAGPGAGVGAPPASISPKINHFNDGLKSCSGGGGGCGGVSPLAWEEHLATKSRVWGCFFSCFNELSVSG